MILSALPVLLQWLPALIDVVSTALGGDVHRDEGAWCAHIADLADVCRGLRDRDTSTVLVVQSILKDVRPDALRAARASLHQRAGK
jgi:membrane protein required for beta-lactamase induction